MKIFKYILILVVVLSSNQLFSQKGDMLKGDEYFNKRMYKEAIESYKLALNEKIVFNKYEMTKRVAQTYKMLFDYQNATEWYEKLVAIEDKIEPQFIFDYALLLCNVEKYEEAKPIFKKYFEVIGKPENYSKYEQSCNWAIANNNKLQDVRIYQTNIETGSRSLGVAFYNDGIVFGKPQAQDFNLKTVYYDLAFAKKLDTAKFDAPVILSGETNHSFYEGSPSFSVDNNKLYYTGNATEITKYNDKKAKRKNIQISNEGVNILKVYQADKKNGNWMRGADLAFNSKEYDCAFPSLSKDGQRLYFVSNMPGGYGGFDVYLVNKENDSTWSKPINLGSEINSELDEMYPYEDSDTLYFSSKGKVGFGGADIYKSYINKNQYGKAENLGKPYNSSKDDFSFIVDNKNRMGYFSSNREGNNGYDHIFEFYFPEHPDTINGIALNKITTKPILGLEVKLHKVNKEGVPELIETFITNNDGKVQLILEKHIEFLVTFYHPGFDSQTFEIPAENRADVVAKFGQLMFMPIPKKNDVIKIDNIYFDYNKASVKEESFPVMDVIAEYLKTNSTISVELSAHTDSRGSDAYNLRLSAGRAKSVVEYLVKKGIERNRLVPKGYGETKLVNKCGNNVQCSEAEHQENRRVELKVL